MREALWLIWLLRHRSDDFCIDTKEAVALNFEQELKMSTREAKRRIDRLLSSLIASRVRGGAARSDDPSVPNSNQFALG